MKIVWKLEGNYGMSNEFTRKSRNSCVSLTFHLVIDSRAIYIYILRVASFLKGSMS